MCLSRCRWPTTRSAGGRTPCSATSTSTVPRASRSTPAARSSPPDGRTSRTRTTPPCTSLRLVEVPMEIRHLQLGSCPDSWGVWFANDPQQTPWSRFLDEMVASGYSWLELGPYGYLPTDPSVLRDELGRRGLSVAGGTVAG